LEKKSEGSFSADSKVCLGCDPKRNISAVSIPSMEETNTCPTIGAAKTVRTKKIFVTIVAGRILSSPECSY